MQVVLLRVGIDTGSGGIHGPIFSDGSFEYIPIPDAFRGKGVDSRTYGNSRGRSGRALVEYFPAARRERLSKRSIHFDPEFETFTYGDPTQPKVSLRGLNEGSLLVFYSGLKGWSFDCPPALYIIGYFEVERAGLATSYSDEELAQIFRNNFHVMHSEVFSEQKERLVLVKGGANSRLLKKAVRISLVGADRNGRRLQRLAPEMQKVFGDFEGKTGIQRCPPRWVAHSFTRSAAEFVLSLR
ncbi:MAG TPA: hypothetical protein VN948_09405 [Terriglobales bacterium]|nr:hypothetical protein [Terriglobales bacterium]